MEREVGGGIRMGNTCKPMAVLLQCMTKFTTKKKKIYKMELQINRLETRVEKMQEMFNKDLEKIKKSQK